MKGSICNLISIDVGWFAFIFFVAFPILLLALIAAVQLVLASFAKEHSIVSTNGAESLWFPNLAMVENCTIIVVTNPHHLTRPTVIETTAAVDFLDTA